MTLVRKMSTRLTLLTVLALLVGRCTGAPQSVVVSPAQVQRAVAVPTSSPYMFRGDQTSATEPVLVVPAKEADAKTVGRIIEDLSIMARIIEKSSGNLIGSTDIASRRLLTRLRRAGGDMTPSPVFSSGGRPKPLYVAGYGALFFIETDYPLAPCPEEKEQSPATEEGDAVWAETKRSLTTPPTGSLFQEDRREIPSYSVERVETLRSNLIGLMKHAANIRDVASTEWLTIVVQGAPAQTDASSGVPGGRTTLTLRATKADVDLYAKGELSHAAFAQRVQVVLR